MNKNFQEILLQEIRIAYQPFVDAVRTGQVISFFHWMGWNMDMLVPNSSQLTAKAQILIDAVQDIGQLLSDPPETLDELVSALNAVNDLTVAVRDIKTIISSTDLSQSEIDKLPVELLENLLQLYLLRRAPVLYRLLELATIIRREAQPVIANSDTIVRYPSALPKLDLSRLVDFLSDPAGVMKDYYFPNGISTQNDAILTAERLFPILSTLLNKIGLEVYHGGREGPEILAHDVEERLKSMITAQRSFLSSNGILLQVGATAQVLPANAQGAGVRIAPFGELSVSHQFGDWLLSFNLNSGIDGFDIRESDFTPYSPTGKTRINAVLVFERNAADVFLIGSTTGTRLEIGEMAFVGQLELNPSEKEYGIFADIKKAALIIKPGDGDGFLQKVLPPDGLKIEFDMIIGWSNIAGFYIKGSGGLEIKIPVHKTIGPLTIDNVLVGIRPQNSAINIALATSGTLKLGPVTAVIEDIGLQSDITFPANGGNLGPVDLDLGFKPPSGIGISIDASGFKGGGFLSIDNVNKRYVGALEVTVKDKISLKIIGVLTTQLPGGQDGYSLLLIITAEFNPIQLGFGFTLNGVGGLIALHRTMRLDALRDGVKNNTIDHILFPSDPVGQINTIITSLEQIFPIQENRFAFGPMGLIAWGAPAVITMEVGLVLEVPNPVRLAILGVIKALLPDENAKILRLQINFVGTVDFEKKFITFDASLFDSTLLQFALSGDMAFRLKYGENPNFLLTVGGFHPSFKAPPLALPPLKRLTISLLNGDNPKLTLQAYFAVTSNTVQVGARIDLSVVLGPLSIVGMLSFDALFQFSPFYFTVSIAAMLAVRSGDKDLLSISLAFNLQGPTPWITQGKAEFKVLGVKFTLNIDRTFGQTQSGNSLPDVNVMQKLVDSVRDTSNWQAEVPNSKFMMVTVKKVSTSGNEIVVHPFGVLTISQKIVPLGMTISKYGNQRPSGPAHFTLQNVKVEGLSVGSLASVKEHFAAAQYLSLSDSEKLSRASFELMNSGVKAQNTEGLTFQRYTKRVLEHETILIDTQRKRKKLDPVDRITTKKAELNAEARLSAVAKTSLSSSKKSAAVVNDKKMNVAQERYVIVNRDNLTKFTTPANTQGFLKESQAEALSALGEVLRSTPELREDLIVVPEYEMNI